MNWPEGAPLRDRMAGRYFSQCPGCREHRTHLLGRDCGGGGPVGARRQRKIEKAAFRKHLAESPEFFWRYIISFPFDPYDVYDDESEDYLLYGGDAHHCAGWCRGWCGARYGNANCEFTDHEAWEKAPWNKS